MDDLPTACYACGREGVLGDGPRCRCGEPRWLATEAEGFEWPGEGGRSGGGDSSGGRTAREGPLAPASSLWRYADLLPVGGERGDTGAPPAGVASASVASTGVASAAGGTPLYRTPRLDGDAGCRIHLKDETANPTGSFKDRGSAVGMAVAAAAGRERIGTVSHGNMARSVAAMAAGAGLAAVVVVPADVPEERLGPIARYGPEVLRVEGDYGDLYRETLSLGGDVGVPFLNSDVPLRVAGQKTLAFEVVEGFAGSSDGFGSPVPDAIVLPVSSGGNASAVWKGLREFRAAGLVDSLPRLYLTQAEACDPVAGAYRRGDEAVSALADGETSETAAYSIANADPPSGTRALAAVRATGGAVVSVPEEELLDARSVLAERAGVAVEPASATALAGLQRLSTDGEIGEDEDVVLIATDAPHGGAESVDVETETVAVADLDDRLRTMVG